MVTNAPLKTMAPACITTDSGVMRQADAIVRAYIARMKCVCWMPLGAPVVPLVYMMLKSASCGTRTATGSGRAPATAPA